MNYEYFRSLAECSNTPMCRVCGGATVRVILSAPMGIVFGRFEPFKSPVDGSLIRTAREMQEHNKRNNVINVADGYSDERVRKGDYRDTPKLTNEERKADIAEAVNLLNQGYKPQRGAEHVDGIE